MLIDSHAHGDPDALDGDPRAYVDACRERGIEVIVLIKPLERCLRAVHRFGDFIIPVTRIDMDTAGPQQARDCIQAGCRGIKFIRLSPTWPSIGASFSALPCPRI